jgi:hypothetical protein
MGRDADILPFRLSKERRQELLLEAAELHERRQQILKILGMVALEDKEDLW